MVRKFAAVAAGLAAVTIGTVATAPAASAHAAVTSSDPADQAHLDHAPHAVTIKFSEGVTTELGGLTVLDSNGNRVDDNDSHQPTPSTLTVTLHDGLPDGALVANYSIISADGHPVRSAIVFTVGNASLSSVAGVTSHTDTSMDAVNRAGQVLTYTGALLAAGLAFFVAVLFDGGPERRRLGLLTRAGVALALAGSVIVLAAQCALVTGGGLGSAADLTVLTGVLRQGLGAQGATLVVGLALCVVSTMSDERKGVDRVGPGSPGRVLAVVGAAVATMSFVLWGHAGQAPNTLVALPADVAHLAAGAVWFGGLVGLLTVLRSRARVEATHGARPADSNAPVAAATHDRQLSDGPAAGRPESPDDRPADRVEALQGSAKGATLRVVDPSVLEEELGLRIAGTNGADHEVGTNGTNGTNGSTGTHHGNGADTASTARIVDRFSTAASVSLAVLTVAGVALSWQELGSFSALTSSDYGRLLLIKVAMVAVIVAVAAYNHFVLLGRHETDAAQSWRSLVRTVRFEALGIVAVLAVTGVLVNTTPGPGTPEAVVPGASADHDMGGAHDMDGMGMTTPFAATLPFSAGKAALAVSPNKAGKNNLHVDVMSADGKPLDSVKKVTLSLTLAAKGVGPIERATVKGGPGHFVADDLTDLSIRGEWTIEVTVRVSEFEQETVAFHDTVN